MYASAAFTGQPWLYVEQIVIDLPGERLEPAAMERAWSDLIVAHPALRNAIISDPSAMPKQSPQPPAGVNLNVLDWSAQSATENTGALSDFLRADRDRGVDASRAPAFRVTLIQTGPSCSKLIWTFPHSLLDGRSFAPLLEEVFNRYALHASGQDVPAPTVQPDVFAAHCQQLARQPHSDGIDHFANLLHGWEGATGLADRTAEPARKNFARHTLSPDQTTALNTLARACDVPVSTVVLAAWAIVLARFTGQSDVVFGNTRNGRHLVAGAQGAAGCFITTVPMRVTLSARMQLATVLRKLREEQLAARPFEHTPLSALRQRLDLQPDRQIFDSVVMFDYGSLHDQLVALNPAWASREADLLEEGDTPVTLAAYMGDQLRIELEYDPSQVADGARLSQYLATFLERLEDANGSTPLAQIPMLPQGETDRLYALAGPDTTSPHGIATAIDRFEQVASQYPDAVALQQPGQDDLSYAVLNAAAIARAQALLMSGVAPGDIVGICLPRGPEFIASLLATWKIGAAFVPMDPAYPVETLNVLAEDSGAKIVLVDENSPRVAAPRLDIETLCIPDDTALPPQARTDPDSLAYVIFTSGSTGRPKGVMISHRSLAAHIDAVVSLYELGQSDRVLQFAALSFDVALEEIVPTLTLGGTLVLRNDEMAQSVSELVRQCVAYRITVMNLPTGFWVALTDVLDQGKITFPPDVRLMIVGGERVPMSALRRWRACNPDLRWINGYGPTEATITSTAHVLQDTDLDLPAVPIGRPLAHARAWVLGPDGALAPEGVEGSCFSPVRLSHSAISAHRSVPRRALCLPRSIQTSGGFMPPATAYAGQMAGSTIWVGWIARSSSAVSGSNPARSKPR
jgi:amino acid adenylation domain-containing protein